MVTLSRPFLTKTTVSGVTSESRWIEMTISTWQKYKFMDTTSPTMLSKTTCKTQPESDLRD